MWIKDKKIWHELIERTGGSVNKAAKSSSDGKAGPKNLLNKMYDFENSVKKSETAAREVYAHLEKRIVEDESNIGFKYPAFEDLFSPTRQKPTLHSFLDEYKSSEDLAVYQESAIREVLEQANEEIEALLAKKYVKRIDTKTSFLNRADSILSKANRIFAVSVEGISTFWPTNHAADHQLESQHPSSFFPEIASDAENSRLSYVENQTLKSIRLFVFKMPETLQTYIPLLNDHAERYGDIGRVFVCSFDTYKKLLSMSFKEMSQWQKIFETRDIAVAVSIEDEPDPESENKKKIAPIGSEKTPAFSSMERGNVDWEILLTLESHRMALYDLQHSALGVIDSSPDSQSLDDPLRGKIGSFGAGIKQFVRLLESKKMLDVEPDGFLELPDGGTIFRWQAGCCSDGNQYQHIMTRLYGKRQHFGGVRHIAVFRPDKQYDAKLIIAAMAALKNLITRKREHYKNTFGLTDIWIGKKDKAIIDSVSKIQLEPDDIEPLVLILKFDRYPGPEKSVDSYFDDPGVEHDMMRTEMVQLLHEGLAWLISTWDDKKGDSPHLQALRQLASQFIVRKVYSDPLTWSDSFIAPESPSDPG